MPFIVVYDANVLYPSLLRNLLIRVAQADLVQAKWTDRIMDEVFRNLKEKRPDLDTAPLDRTRKLNSSTWTGRRFTPPCSGWRTPSRIHP